MKNYRRKKFFGNRGIKRNLYEQFLTLNPLQLHMFISFKQSSIINFKLEFSVKSFTLSCPIIYIHFQ